MKRIGSKFLAAFAATVFSVGTANAATVVIGEDNLSTAYVRNAEFGAVRPVAERLKGRTVKSGNAYVPKNTRFVITNVKPLDSGALKVGDKVAFALAEDFTVNDTVVIQKGTQLYGVVSEAKHGGVFSRRERLTIDVNEIITDEGIPLALRCVVRDHAKGSVYFPAGAEFIATTVADTDLQFAVTRATR